MQTIARAEFTTGGTDRFLIVAGLVAPFEQLVEIVGPTGRIERVVARGLTRSFVPGLSQSFGAKWSPDGRLLAWVSPAGVTVERADGTRRRLLVPKRGGCPHVCVPLTFAWSPDSRRLVVGGAGKQTTRLLVVSVRDGRSRDIARVRADTVYRVFGWSRDGRSIVYLRNSLDPKTTSAKLDLMVARADGTRPRRLFSVADGGLHDTPAASLSPDGRFIAFTTDARDPRDPRLAVIDVASGRMRRIRGLNPAGLTPPAWSPDSRRIAVAGGNVVTLAASGGQIRSVGAAGVSVAWGRSGDLFIVSGRSSRNLLVSRGGVKPARLLFRVLKSQSIMTIDPN